jgi:hypothetical protein
MIKTGYNLFNEVVIFITILHERIGFLSFEFSVDGEFEINLSLLNTHFRFRSWTKTKSYFIGWILY